MRPDCERERCRFPSCCGHDWEAAKPAQPGYDLAVQERMAAGLPFNKAAVAAYEAAVRDAPRCVFR